MKPARKRPARQPLLDVGNRSNIVYVTICTDGRKPILANEAVHQLLLECWLVADHWKVGRYMILPDHIHFFCSPARPDYLPVKKWVAFWKSKASRDWPKPEQQPIWQIDAWDRQLRNGDGYSAKWEYVRENPVRHGLVECAEDWPYQGELNALFWHER